MVLFGLFKKRRAGNTYRKGVRVERIVAGKLRSKGYLVRRSPGSRGPYDLYAMKSGRKLLVQVKSGAAKVSRKEIKRLRAVAREKRARGLIMRLRRGKMVSKFV